MQKTVKESGGDCDIHHQSVANQDGEYGGYILNLVLTDSLIQAPGYG
jgi:hypothetical protein